MEEFNPFKAEEDINNTSAYIDAKILNPETLERARKLAEAEHQIEAEKRRLSDQKRLFREAEMKRREEARKRKIAEVRRAEEPEKSLYEALSSSAEVLSSDAREYITVNPGTPGMLNILMSIASTKTALKKK